MRWALAFAVSFAALAGALARTIELSEACFADFCVEGPDAFVRLRADEPRKRYLIKFFANDHTVYLYRLPSAMIPNCGENCRLEVAKGEMTATHPRLPGLVGRVFGPFEACRGGAPFYVTARVYFPLKELERLDIQRRCR